MSGVETATVLLRGEEAIIDARVTATQHHTIALRFAESQRPADGTRFLGAELWVGERTINLGRVEFHAHPKQPMRRASDPKLPPGDGVLTTLDDVFDFDKLQKKGLVTSLTQRIEQLPIIFGRRHGILPAFATLVAETIYDLQVMRSAFDEIDRALIGEDPPISERVRETVLRTRYATFTRLFDDKLSELGRAVAEFSREQHEQHGFYFRKQAWDLILSSEFMARTNLKPRGYAGDSEMMRMLYENDFRGPTLFSRFLHRHPIESAAAQAVRNRVALIGELVRDTVKKRDGVVKVMSVACGPARELKHAVSGEGVVARIQLTLLDQDEEALGEARGEVDAIGKSMGPLNARYEQQSVRRMLQSTELAERLSGQDLVYSMGLFDYLTAPVARAVVQRLYTLLSPGGELVIGNFHVGNETRVYMEYWMDWVLYYRTEEEMLALCDGLSGAEASVFFEKTKSQMFLRVKKNG